MNDDELRNWLEVKLGTFQFILEFMIANSCNGQPDKCEAFGKLLADWVRQAHPYIPPGSGPVDLENAKRQDAASADEIERIFGNAARRIREALKNQNDRLQRPTG